MLDNILKSMNEMAVVLLPILGALVLIALTILLFKIIKLVNALPETLNRVNDTIESTQASIKKLDAPLDAIIGVSHTVDLVNKSANGIVGTAMNFAVKNSDNIVNWGKDFFVKDSKKDKKDEALDKQEDFGIYD